MIKNENFKIMSICQDGYECSGEVYREQGTIIKLINDLFYMDDVSETFKDGYISFKDFLEKATKESIKEGYSEKYIITTDVFASLFISEISTSTYQYISQSTNKRDKFKDIVEYLNTLYISEEYIENYGYNMLFNMH